MQPTVPLWTTPSIVHDIARKRHVFANELEDFAVKLQSYIDLACKPLLATDPKLLPVLRHTVTKYAIASWQPRAGLIIALDRIVRANVELLDEIAAAEAVEPDLRSAVARVLTSEAIENFEMGTRINQGLLPNLLKRLRDADVRQEAAANWGEWYGWMHISSCLDLSATSVLWYMAEDRDPARARVAGELCFLVRELALMHAARAHKLLGRPAGRRKAVAARLSAADRGWDTEFATAAFRSVSAQLGV